MTQPMTILRHIIDRLRPHYQEIADAEFDLRMEHEAARRADQETRANIKRAMEGYK